MPKEEVEEDGKKKGKSDQELEEQRKREMFMMRIYEE